MRLAILAAYSALLASTPALANEARVEARGGVVFGSGDEEAIAGVAAGYDYDLGTSAFVGGEVTADKILTDGTKVSFGFNGRIGAKLGEQGKLYAVGGYNTEACDLCDGTWTAGAGYEHSFGKIYGKLEYRHFFVDNGFDDLDAVSVGIGTKF
jgi:hypothetical protein